MYVTILPTKYVKGYKGIHGDEEYDELTTYETAELVDALTREYTTDVHFVQYHVPGRDRIPRLNKSSLTYFETGQAGPVPHFRSMFVDVDFPLHDNRELGWHNVEDWPESYRVWMTAIDHAMATIPELAYAGMYLTRGGMRFVWPLAGNGLDVRYARSYTENFHEYLATNGLPLDRNTKDWTRLFRAPFGVRDGKPQRFPHDFSRMAPLVWLPQGVVLELESVSSVGNAAYTELNEEYEEFLARAPMLGSDWSLLRNMRDYNALRSGTYPMVQGSRHNTLIRLAAAIANAARTTDPGFILRALAPTVKPELDKGLAWKEVWDVAVWGAATYDATEKFEVQERENVHHSAASEIGVAPKDVVKHLVLRQGEGGGSWIYDENAGMYRGPFDKDNVPCMMLELCPTLSYMDPEENYSLATVMKLWGTTIKSAVASYLFHGTHFDAVSGKVRIGNVTFNPHHTPRYHEHVDRWLRALLGDQVEHGLNWLAGYTTLREPMCALYIHGPAGIGKSLLTLGLEGVYDAKAIPFTDVVGQFQDKLMSSPLVSIDEGVPDDKGSSDMFRRLVSGGGMTIRKMYSPRIDLEGVPRLLITANNPSALKIDEDLTPEDIEAIGQRVGYIRTDARAKHVLDELAREGGFETRRDMTNKWVERGDISEHVRWLGETRKFKGGERFLVDGWKSSFTDTFALRSSTVKRVILGLLRLLTRFEDGHSGTVAAIVEGALYVSPEGFEKQWGMVFGPSARTPTVSARTAAFQAISSGLFEVHIGTQELVMYRVRHEYLMESAEASGVCTKESLAATLRKNASHDTATVKRELDHNREVKL